MIEPTLSTPSTLTHGSSPVFDRSEAKGRLPTVSAVSWQAIIAGAFVSASILWVLSVLGTGLGLSVVSPWPSTGIAATTAGIGVAIWLLLSQAIAALLGGYLSGRLRTNWEGVNGDEVYFRDTAQGLITWAVGVVLTVAILTGGAAKVASGTAQVGVDMAQGAGQTAMTMASSLEVNNGNQYFVDQLLRSSRPAEDAVDTVNREEITRIVTLGLANGTLPEADKRYLAQVIAKHSGTTVPEAEGRVEQVIDAAKQAKARAEETAREVADVARRSGAYLAFWGVASLLLGAFCASLAATFGGRQRDSKA